MEGRMDGGKDGRRDVEREGGIEIRKERWKLG
jgi:hypothetical protein